MLSVNDSKNMSHPSKERTLIIIKPDGIQRTLVGEIISRYERLGLKFHFIDLTKTENIRQYLNEKTKLIWLETPSNPLMNVIDIKACVEIAKTKNISAGGICFVTNEDLSINSFIEIELYLPNHTIESLAKVVHCMQLNNNGSREVGVMFVNLPKETEIRLNKYFELLS